MQNTHETWLTTFNSNTCRVYHYSKNELDLFKTIEHPENRQHDTDITADKSGNYKSPVVGTSGTFAQASDPKEIQVDNFAREIANLLESARTAGSLKKLILVAPPHMMGLVNKHISKQVEHLVLHDIKKDFMFLPEKELLRSVNHIIEEKKELD
ncbi:MAG: host attachment protein [Legionella sp.]|nr:host attachment protein [Legionella sp.]